MGRGRRDRRRGKGFQIEGEEIKDEREERKEERELGTKMKWCDDGDCRQRMKGRGSWLMVVVLSWGSVSQEVNQRERKRRRRKSKMKGKGRKRKGVAHMRVPEEIDLVSGADLACPFL